MSEAVKQLEAALHNQPANPLRNAQVEEYQAEERRLREVVQAPAYVTGVDRGAANRRAREVSKLINEQVAKPLSGDTKDRVAKLANEVMENVIKPALLPREEMRRNPAGAVGRFMRQENSREIKRAVQNWKRAMLAVESGNPDPDLANIERFRPEVHTPGQAATFMANAQIPGKFAMSAAAKENWPANMPEQGTVNSPLAQVQKRERTQAQKDALARAQAARAEKRKEKAG
jgi:hypothetical protein